MTVFLAKNLYTPLQSIEAAAIAVEDGRIVSVGPRTSTEVASNKDPRDFGDGILAPGFIDLHFHGAAGCDVMRGSPGEREKMEIFLARHGVTSYFPTTVCAPLDLTLTALERLADSIEGAKRDHGRARAIGIHLEGPFLSCAKRGVHQAEYLIAPSIGVFEKLWQAAGGHVRMMTIAPELENAEEVIREATRRGVCVSLGHSNADVAATRRGIEAGARHATHTFNAMRPLDHRNPGILGEVLTNDAVTCDVIADGIHVDRSMVKLLARAKGPHKLVLITDALSATGMPDGKYQLGTLEIEVKNGVCLHNGTFAGSILTTDRAVRNLMQFAGWDLRSAVQAATLNPARSAGVPKKGTIETGADADFVVLTHEGEVRATVVGGSLVQ
ncbi:MAG TPA: N-acetylglucosamine-6-phosphate deacetylase [Terriglobales bacterium]